MFYKKYGLWNGGACFFNQITWILVWLVMYKKYYFCIYYLLGLGSSIPYGFNERILYIYIYIHLHIHMYLHM